jgi:DNA repair protein RecN (Recombination protein N)
MGYVLIAGGVGITPLYSMCQTLAEREDVRPVLLFYGAGKYEELTFREELDALDGASFERKQLAKTVEEADARLAELAGELSAGRAEAAADLEGEVGSILPDVGLGGGRFRVSLEPRGDVGGGGAEAVTFLVSLNVGFEARPLARVASGGELSRVMLALKTILARVDRVPSLVFDEIDAGIGGKVGVQIGAKLRQVADHHQVFVITHLPQIAARAHHQILVEKVEHEGTTLTRLTELADEERVRELARMLGGDPESATSLEHARELLA